MRSVLYAVYQFLYYESCLRNKAWYELYHTVLVQYEPEWNVPGNFNMLSIPASGLQRWMNLQVDNNVSEPWRWIQYASP
jgi:hypothetical protein